MIQSRKVQNNLKKLLKTVVSYIFFHKTLLKMFLPSFRIFGEFSFQVRMLFAALSNIWKKSVWSCKTRSNLNAESHTILCLCLDRKKSPALKSTLTLFTPGRDDIRVTFGETERLWRHRTNWNERLSKARMAEDSRTK